MSAGNVDSKSALEEVPEAEEEGRETAASTSATDPIEESEASRDQEPSSADAATSTSARKTPSASSDQPLTGDSSVRAESAADHSEAAAASAEVKSHTRSSSRHHRRSESESSAGGRKPGAGAKARTSFRNGTSPTSTTSSAGSSTGSAASQRRARSRTQSNSSIELQRSGPPELSRDELKQLECAFVLDNVALSFRANAEPHRTSPSMNIGIPQYNAQFDPHAMNYFEARGVTKTLRKNLQDRGGSSMAGEVFDTYVAKSHTVAELKARNAQGAGYHYEEEVCGHNIPVAKPFNGYNGPNGYRRNTFHLRNAPSSFGFQGRPMQPKSKDSHTPSLYTDT